MLRSLKYFIPAAVVGLVSAKYRYDENVRLSLFYEEEMRVAAENYTERDDVILSFKEDAGFVRYWNERRNELTKRLEARGTQTREEKDFYSWLGKERQREANETQ